MADGLGSSGSTAASGRSDVWEYFDEPTRNNVGYAAKCKICRKDYVVRPGGGTGHLKRHALSCKKKQGIHMTQQQLQANPDGSVRRLQNITSEKQNQEPVATFENLNLDEEDP